MLRHSPKRDSDDSLAIRAAWLHYVSGLTQADVAARLGITNVKAHRLIARAVQNGAIKVTVVGDVAECVALEDQLATHFGLDYCEVVPDLHEVGLPLRALGSAGSAFLQREIEAREDCVIGIGNGRTLAAAVADMPRVPADNVRFVSLLGGLTRNYAANPYDVMHRLAEKTNATAFAMPAPFFANSAEDRDVLLSQRGVRDVLAIAAEAELIVLGIGSARSDTQLVASHVIEPHEVEEVVAAGGVGELLGYFFDINGNHVSTSLADRLLSPPLEAMKGRRIVAIAGGLEKVDAILAVLASGYLKGLITDERTAQALITRK